LGGLKGIFIIFFDIVGFSPEAKNGKNIFLQINVDHQNEKTQQCCHIFHKDRNLDNQGT